MHRVSAIGLLACVSLLGGCTAISDFGRYMFGPGGGSDAGVDGGMVRNDGGEDDGGGIGGDGGEDGGLPDGSIVDAAVDAQVDSGFDAGPRIPTGVVQTSGGALITTPQYRLRISVGAPQPVGDVESSAHRLRVGPQPR
jgi:hypothetical protein